MIVIVIVIMPMCTLNGYQIFGIGSLRVSQACSWGFFELDGSICTFTIINFFLFSGLNTSWQIFYKSEVVTAL